MCGVYPFSFHLDSVTGRVLFSFSFVCLFVFDKFPILPHHPAVACSSPYTSNRMYPQPRPCMLGSGSAPFCLATLTVRSPFRAFAGYVSAFFCVATPTVRSSFSRSQQACFCPAGSSTVLYSLKLYAHTSTQGLIPFLPLFSYQSICGQTKYFSHKFLYGAYSVSHARVHPARTFMLL